MPYFNYAIVARDAATASWLDRRDFIHNWWRLYRDDRRWTPPLYNELGRELQPGRNPHLARLMPGLVRVEALYRNNVPAGRQDQPVPLANVFDQPLAAAVYALDPRRTDRTGYLALLQTSSDEEGLDRLLSHAKEAMRPLRVRRVIGPTGLSPHLDSGVLVDAWDAWPPLHTPSNPPYLPERLGEQMTILQTGRLYEAAVPDSPPAGTGPAALEPLDPARLAGDLLPLLGEATANPTAGFAPPDEAEAAFLLRWLGVGALSGWMALIDNRPVGFVLLGPDQAAARRRSAGGRKLLGRLTASLRPEPSPAGRLYFGAVAAGYRRRGIGRQLWAAALQTAAAQGWTALRAGPVWLPEQGQSAAAAFLTAVGAAPRQTYHLYERLL